ncbi:site-specific integrase [Candidatus Woesearchaeota archaeon]|nr:site-specific integrase [Candidatus Woesearchaeota archaeon]
MSNIKRDIHKQNQKLQNLINQIKNHKKIDSKTKKLILQFERDASIGMHGGRTSVGQAKRGRYLEHIKDFITWNDYKPITKNKKINLTKKSYVELINKLTEDKVLKQNGQSYSDETKSSTIKAFNLFLKYLNQQENYELNFLPKARHKIIESNPVTIDKNLWLDIAHTAKNWQNKAIIITGFDSGARPMELLSMKIKDVLIQTDKNTQQKTIQLNLNATKTNSPRKINVPIATSLLREWLKRHPDKDNENALLFNLSYDQYRRSFAQATKIVTNKSYNLYTMRKSSITYYGDKVLGGNLIRLGKRSGHVLGSKSLRRYVNTDEIDANEVVKKEWENDQVSQIKKENIGLQEQQDRLQKELSDMKAQMQEMLDNPLMTNLFSGVKKSLADFEKKVKEQE